MRTTQSRTLGVAKWEGLPDLEIQLIPLPAWRLELPLCSDVSCVVWWIRFKMTQGWLQANHVHSDPIENGAHVLRPATGAGLFVNCMNTHRVHSGYGPKLLRSWHPGLRRQVVVHRVGLVADSTTRITDWPLVAGRWSAGQ